MSLFDDKTAKRRKGQPAQAATTAPAGEAQPDSLEENAVPLGGDDPLAAVALTKADLAPPVEPELRLPVIDEQPAQAVVEVKATRVRVVQDGKALLGSCNHTFKVGNILDANHYDDATFRRILAAIHTEPVEG
jgi:hypothetical protein